MILFTKAISPLLALRGYMATPRNLEIFLVVMTGWRATDRILWVEARDATEYPLMHREAPLQEEFPAQNETAKLRNLSWNNSPSTPFAFQKDFALCRAPLPDQSYSWNSLT